MPDDERMDILRHYARCVGSLVANMPKTARRAKARGGLHKHGKPCNNKFCIEIILYTLAWEEVYENIDTSLQPDWEHRWSFGFGLTNSELVAHRKQTVDGSSSCWK